MTKPSRILLIGASSAFGLCCAGLLAGMVYTLLTYFSKGQSIDQILGNSIAFYKLLGALGVLGFLLFFLFLFSLVSRLGKRD